MTILRRRLIDDLRIRNYAPGTIEIYVRAVAQLAQHFGQSPDRLGPEEIRSYLVFLVRTKKVSWSIFKQHICALRFFYQTTLSREWMVERVPFPRREKKLPVVLSQQEIAAFFRAISNLKHRTILMTMYAAGLRVSEVGSGRRNARPRGVDSWCVHCIRAQIQDTEERPAKLSPEIVRGGHGSSKVAV